jgi:pyruvate dehydrogenase E1 component beta subunit
MIMTMVQAINQALAGEMARDDRIVILGEDVGRDGGVFRATDGLYDRFGPERVMDTPLAESAAVGAAIGMAALGLRPVVEIQFMGFIYPAFNQIVSHVARLRNRTRGRFTAPVVIRTPYGAGVGALEHHSESTEALFCQIPGLTVVVPSSASDAKGLLTAALRGDDPVLFLEPTRLYRAEKQEVPEEPYEAPLRRAAVVREGRDQTIVAWGAMIPVARKAAAAAEAEGVGAEIVDLRTLSPMDRETVLASVRKTGRALVLHEAPKTGGLGAEIAATIGERALLSLNAPVLRVTAPDITVPLPKSEDLYYPNAERVLRTVRKLMEY